VPCVLSAVASLNGFTLIPPLPCSHRVIARFIPSIPISWHHRTQALPLGSIPLIWASRSRSLRSSSIRKL
jgi:hypothetical protein